MRGFEISHIISRGWHNITFYNWFSSYKLGQLLIKRNIIVNTKIRKNKPKFPSEFAHSKVYCS